MAFVKPLARPWGPCYSFTERSFGLLLAAGEGDGAMNMMTGVSPWERLIRPDRVHGSLYTDPEIFEAELKQIAETLLANPVIEDVELHIPKD